MGSNSTLSRVAFPSLRPPAVAWPRRTEYANVRKRANNGLKLTGNSVNGEGMQLENSESGGHNYTVMSGGSLNDVGASGFDHL